MLNLGRPTAPPLPGTVVPIDNALFADGDTMPALSAVREIRARLTSPHPPAWQERWELACWDLMHGDFSTARGVVADFRAHTPPEFQDQSAEGAEILAPGLLEAWIAIHGTSANDGAMLRHLDSLAATGRDVSSIEENTLLLGRLFSTLGQPERALKALRRVTHFLQVPYARSTLWLARARAAVAAGKKAEAIEAYRIYLALRSDPAPRLVPQRDSARAEVARLE